MTAIDTLRDERVTAKLAHVDWPTVGLAIGIYAAFGLLTWFALDLAWWLILPLGAVIVCLQSSLQHEAIHGYPTPWRWVNTLIAAPALWLWLPYGVNRLGHLQHHVDENLTDPRLDPETNYLTAKAWSEMSILHRAVRQVMATLLGRMVIGPLYYAAQTLGDLIYAARRRDGAVLRAWLLHAVAVSLLLWWVMGVCGISFGAYLLLFAWPGTALALIRSFAEHRAAPDVAARTATIEAGWLMRFLFLNNNLHALHHADPTAAWHARPAVYRAQRASVLARSRYHFVPSYASLFRNYLLDAKEPLMHPTESRSHVGAAGAAVEQKLATA
jgi:fatty acid desaturase